MTAVWFLIFVCASFGLTLYLVILGNSVFGGLDFASDERVVAIVTKIIHAYGKPRAVLYDLGSARGSFATAVAKKFPLLKIFGVDDSWFRTSYAQAQSLFVTNAHFLNQDIFNTNISQADILYIYLPQELMLKLEEKLKSELKPGSVIITNKVQLPSWQATKIFSTDAKRPLMNRLFVYTS